MNARHPLRLTLGVFLFSVGSAFASDPDPKTFWNPDDLKPGMKGHGVTVMRGATLEKFQAEVLGVLKNTSPGRDLVLARLSGLDLERTGVIAGMSGSPVYIDNRLVGAVAYSWAYGKDPIAGITPFSQMLSFAEASERRGLAGGDKPIRVGLREPVRVDGKFFDAVTVSQTDGGAKLGEADGLWMQPLRAPVSAGGFTTHSLRMLRERFPESGLVPVQGGGVAAKLAEEAKKVKIEPGAAMSVALISGDFDMSGIGTVTHVDGQRVWGFGHPFMSLGGCDLPLMTGWVHTVYPRLSVSFKMGSPLQAVGVVNADVSTGIAGWLGREPDLLPMSMAVRREPGGDRHQFNVQIVRQKQLLPALVFAALTNSVDMEGDLPEEMTVAFTCRIEIEGQQPIVIKDTFAGPSYSGGRAPSNLYNPVAMIVSQLVSHPFKPLRITKIDCDTEILPGRLAAELESIEMEADTYSPGETLKGNAFVRPYKGALTKVPFSLPIPIDLPDGSYNVMLSDGLTAARAELRGKPHLNNPQDEKRMLEALRLLTSAKRNELTVRLPLPVAGVALEGKPLTDLPPSVAQILGQTRRSPAVPLTSAAVSIKPTGWVIVGTETVHIKVARAKKVTVTKD
jgi:hypothetical protein